MSVLRLPVLLERVLTSALHFASFQNKALQEAQTKAATAAANAPAPVAAASTSSSSSPSLGSHEVSRPTCQTKRKHGDGNVSFSDCCDTQAPEEVQKIREDLADARTVEENRLKEIQKLRQDRAELKNELNELNDKVFVASCF